MLLLGQKIVQHALLYKRIHPGEFLEAREAATGRSERGSVFRRDDSESHRSGQIIYVSHGGTAKRYLLRTPFWLGPRCVNDLDGIIAILA